MEKYSCAARSKQIHYYIPVPKLPNPSEANLAALFVCVLHGAVQVISRLATYEDGLFCLLQKWYMYIKCNDKAQLNHMILWLVIQLPS